MILEQHVKKITRMTDREARGARLGVDVTRTGNQFSLEHLERDTSVMIDPTRSGAGLRDISLKKSIS